MALEEHETKQLEDRFDRMENKLKTTFLEVEKRLVEIKQQPSDVEDRIQELEDLILLMQLEITKLKEKTGTTAEFLTPESPNILERMNRMEEAMSMKAAEEPKAEEGEPLFEETEEITDAHGEPIVVKKAALKEEAAEEETEERPAKRGKSLAEEVQQILSS